MPRGVPKTGFRKTRNWQKRQPKASTQPPQKKQEVETEESKNNNEPEKIEDPIPQKHRRARKNKTPDSFDETATSSITSAKVGKLICSKLDEWAEGCCTTEKAFAEMLGGCEFCDRSSKPTNILVITSAKNPKLSIRMCRRCLSVCAAARLDL